MPPRRRLAFLALAALLAAPAPAPGAGPSVREWGLRAAGGLDESKDIQYYAIQPYAGLALWEPASRWLASRGVTALWIVEPWVALVRARREGRQTDSFEIGVSPIFFRFAFGRWRLRPFVEGGEGIVYTDLRQQQLGTRVHFTSQVGAGIAWEIRPDLALTLAGRYRHLSNAGLSRTNPGTDTVYGLVGLTFR
jgi:hypothetical protein